MGISGRHAHRAQVGGRSDVNIIGGVHRMLALQLGLVDSGGGCYNDHSDRHHRQQGHRREVLRSPTGLLPSFLAKFTLYIMKGKLYRKELEMLLGAHIPVMVIVALGALGFNWVKGRKN